MRKTLSEWIEWADTEPTLGTSIADGEWVLVEYVRQVNAHEDAHRKMSGLPTNYDQKITLVKPRTIRKTK